MIMGALIWDVGSDWQALPSPRQTTDSAYLAQLSDDPRPDHEPERVKAWRTL